MLWLISGMVVPSSKSGVVVMLGPSSSVKLESEFSAEFKVVSDDLELILAEETSCEELLIVKVGDMGLTHSFLSFILCSVRKCAYR
jgi:hypothetical protein